MLITDTLISNFRMYTHLFTESINTGYIAGVYEDTHSQEIFITAAEVDGGRFVESPIFAKIQVPEDMTVVNMISQRFSSKEFEVLVTTVNREKIYSNYLIDLTDSRPGFESLFESSSTPILIAGPDDLSPLLVFGTYKKDSIKTVAASIDQIRKRKLQIDETRRHTHIINGVELRGVHTSTFLALHKNMHAVLALHVKGPEEKKNSMVFYDLIDNQELACIELPGEIGPIIFSELIDGIGADMIYVSKENGKCFLNIHRNTVFTSEEETEFRMQQNFKKFFEEGHGKTTGIFEEAIRLDLSEFSDFGSPVLCTHDRIPTGIFLSELGASGGKMINLVFKNGNKTALRTFELKSDGFGHELVVSDNQLLDSDEGIVNVSFTEIDSDNQEYLLISTSNNSLKLSRATKNGNGRMYLNLLAMKSCGKSYIPGATFCIIYENNTKLIKASQGPQTSYPSLQRHKYVGISKTDFFINFVVLKAPLKNWKNSFYSAVSVIIPNTFSTFTYSKGKWFRRSYFLSLHYVNTATGVLIVLLAFPIAFWLVSYLAPYLFYEDKKDAIGDSTKKVFKAL